jgi:hypothetical protein
MKQRTAVTVVGTVVHKQLGPGTGNKAMGKIKKFLGKKYAFFTLQNMQIR